MTLTLARENGLVDASCCASSAVLVDEDAEEEGDSEEDDVAGELAARPESVVVNGGPFDGLDLRPPTGTTGGGARVMPEPSSPSSELASSLSTTSLEWSGTMSNSSSVVAMSH